MAGGADNVTGTDAVGLVLRRPRVRRLRQTLAAGLREAVAAADLPAAGRAEAERHIARLADDGEVGLAVTAGGGVGSAAGVVAVLLVMAEVLRAVHAVIDAWKAVPR